ncbi:MAG: nucleotidyltransferase [Pirellulales bacterium]
MNSSQHDLSQLLEIIIDHIDIPKSYYEKAAARHRSLGEWLHRSGSKVAAFDPDVRPQGSFRYGTVTRPINPEEVYDLDNVCLLRALNKGDLTQEQLKELYGDEIKAYAREHSMLAPAEEHNRCWRLRYADEVSFHLDTLPCVPELGEVIRYLLEQQVPSDLANRAIAITDRKHPQYRVVTLAWYTSNPRGFASWFEQRAALGRRRALAEARLRAAVEDVPPYEWKTTLQQSIQLLKRHRDTMFRHKLDVAPISMIITNLAAHAYGGETDLAEALQNIVDGMPQHVRSTSPRVPNPAHPAEDYADKWSKDSRLEKNFWEWHAAVQADLARLSTLLGRSTLSGQVKDLFLVDMTEEEVRKVGGEGTSRPSISVKSSPVLTIPTASKPWGRNG